MWIICGMISVFFCVMSWIMTIQKKGKANWASICSLSFVAITILMQYKMVLKWVNKGDWSAMLDVVPTMFLILCGYVSILLLANIAAIVKSR